MPKVPNKMKEVPETQDLIDSIKLLIQSEIENGEWDSAMLSTLIKLKEHEEEDKGTKFNPEDYQELLEEMGTDTSSKKFDKKLKKVVDK